MSRLLMISSDCHVSPERSTWADYVPNRYHDDLERWLELPPGLPPSGAEFDEAGQWDDAVRWKALESDGVAAEVVFPNFDLAFTTRQDAGEPELAREGARAYNRWLADFCAEAPGRRTGHVVACMHDIDDTAAELRRGVQQGVRGVTIPAPLPGFPFYYHPRYEVLWSTCAELGVPVVVHSSVGTPIRDWTFGGEGLDGDDAERHAKASMTQSGPEFSWHARRVIWQMMYGGVFSRHPDLRLVVTEAYVDWVPDLAVHLDWLHSGSAYGPARIRRELCTERPSEIMARQLYYGASFMSLHETQRRHEIGIDRIMFGVDYPHFESTVPFTAEWMQATFGACGVTPAELDLMAATTTADVYGFDLDALRPIADRVGLEVGQVLSDDPVPPDTFGRMSGQHLRPLAM